MNFLPLALATLAASTLIASATVVNIDFSANLTTADRHTGLAAATDPAGSGAIWNNILGAAGTVSAVNLVSSTGTATDIDISIAGVTGVKKSASEQEITTTGIGGGSYGRLMGDYLEIDSGSNSTVISVTGTISGLLAGIYYDLYFYAQGSDLQGAASSSAGENALITVGGNIEQTGWDGVIGGNGTLTEGLEYVKFTAQANGGGIITFDWANVVPGGNVQAGDFGALTGDLAPSSTGTGSQFSGLNGIQIVQVVPEPSSALLGLFGMAGLLVRRRR